jgi:hypothetical protein
MKKHLLAVSLALTLSTSVAAYGIAIESPAQVSPCVRELPVAMGALSDSGLEFNGASLVPVETTAEEKHCGKHTSGIE